MAPLKVATEKELTVQNLEALVNDEILALVVPGYYDAWMCDQLAQKILASNQLQRYTHEVQNGQSLLQLYFGVDRLGMPFNSTYNDEEMVSRYYDEASKGIKALRKLAHNGFSPIDRLRLELDEMFPDGATIATFEGRKMLAGISRITNAHLSYLSAEEPHYDALPEKYARLDTQLAANVYLRVPQRGGELELWDISPLPPLFEAPSNWRAQLPEPHVIQPQQGDLVIFNCRRPHAIGEFEGPARVTTQVFIGHQKGSPLKLWN